MNSQRPHHIALTKEQWTDLTDPVNDLDFQQDNADLQEIDWRSRERSQQISGTRRKGRCSRPTHQYTCRPLQKKPRTTSSQLEEHRSALMMSHKTTQPTQSLPGLPNSEPTRNKTTELKTPRKTVSRSPWYSPTFHKRPQSRHLPNPLHRNLVWLHVHNELALARPLPSQEAQPFCRRNRLHRRRYNLATRRPLPTQRRRKQPRGTTVVILLQSCQSRPITPNVQTSSTTTGRATVGGHLFTPGNHQQDF
jgi:hypothetical protein